MGDVVLLQQDATTFCAGQVWAHAVCNEVPLVLVQVLKPDVLTPEEGSATWTIEENYQVWPAEEVIEAVTWQSLPDNRVRTLLPMDIELRL